MQAFAGTQPWTVWPFIPAPAQQTSPPVQPVSGVQVRRQTNTGRITAPPPPSGVTVCW